MFRVIGPHRFRELECRHLKLFDRYEFDARAVAREQQLLGVLDEFQISVEHEIEAVLVGQLLEGLAVLGGLDQRPGRNIVKTGDDRIAETPSEFLGFVLGPGDPAHLRRGANEGQARILHGFDELRVLRHETVAGKYMGVSVSGRDLDDFGDPLELLCLPRAHVVWDPMHIAHIRNASQLRRQTSGIDDRIFFGKQNARRRDANLGKNIKGFLAHRAATHNQALDRRKGKRTQPIRLGFVKLSLP